MLKVLVGPRRLLRIGRVARGLGEGIVMAFGMEKGRDWFFHDFLLIQRPWNERGSSCIFEPANHTDVIGQGSRTHDKWVRQPESKVGGGQVHFICPPCRSSSGDSVCGRSGSAAGTLMPANCW